MKGQLSELESEKSPTKELENEINTFQKVVKH